MRQVRDDAIHTPILLFTARDSVRDWVNGLDAGADYYLAKPFAFVELLARLRTLLRRPHNQLEIILRYIVVKQLSLLNHFQLIMGKR